MTKCRCNHEVETPYCPHCGFKQPEAEKAPAVSLLIYLKGQRSKAQSWADKHTGTTREKYMISVARWNVWIDLIARIENYEREQADALKLRVAVNNVINAAQKKLSSNSATSGLVHYSDCACSVCECYVIRTLQKALQTEPESKSVNS